MAPYVFKVERALRTIPQIICAHIKENVIFGVFYDVNLGTKSETDSTFAFPSVKFRKIRPTGSTYCALVRARFSR